MDLEFQESDIIFSSDQNTRELGDSHAMPVVSMSSRRGSDRSRKSISKHTKKKEMAIQTVPIDVPCKLFHQKREPGSRSTGRGDEVYNYDDDDDEEEMVPPHVIMGRRIAGKIAFSVCTGIGRTLKGRDLREVRNSILRLTGFLES